METNGLQVCLQLTPHACCNLQSLVQKKISLPMKLFGTDVSQRTFPSQLQIYAVLDGQVMDVGLVFLKYEDYGNSKNKLAVSNSSLITRSFRQHRIIGWSLLPPTAAIMHLAPPRTADDDIAAAALKELGTRVPSRSAASQPDDGDGDLETDTNADADGDEGEVVGALEDEGGRMKSVVTSGQQSAADEPEHSSQDQDEFNGHTMLQQADDQQFDETQDNDGINHQNVPVITIPGIPFVDGDLMQVGWVGSCMV